MFSILYFTVGYDVLEVEKNISSCHICRERLWRRWSINRGLITGEKCCVHQPASWQQVCWWQRCRCWCPWLWEQPAGPSALPKHTDGYHRLSRLPQYGCIVLDASAWVWDSHPEETMLTTIEEEVDELWTSRVTRMPMTTPARGLDKTVLSWKMLPAVLPGHTSMDILFSTVSSTLTCFPVYSLNISLWEFSESYLSQTQKCVSASCPAWSVPAHCLQWDSGTLKEPLV